MLLFEHDLFGKPLRTFPDHALAYDAAAHANLSGGSFCGSACLKFQLPDDARARHDRRSQPEAASWE
jgi:hypothetical protein